MEVTESRTMGNDSKLNQLIEQAACCFNMLSPSDLSDVRQLQDVLRQVAEVAEGLRRRGHKVVVDDPWTHGRCLAIRFDPETGVIYGGASPRTGDSAIGW